MFVCLLAYGLPSSDVTRHIKWRGGTVLFFFFFLQHALQGQERQVSSVHLGVSDGIRETSFFLFSSDFKLLDDLALRVTARDHCL